jgi:hypothetical protein
MKRKLIAVAIVVGVCLGVVVTRAVWEGQSALSDGDAASERGEKLEAINKWRRAARWYVPLAPHVGKAYDRLEDMAATARTNGDVAVELAALRGVRGSILATRSFFTPHSHRLDRANQRIAELMASIEGGAVSPDQTEDQRRQWHYDLLSRDDSPSVLWSVIALIGFGGWIGGAVFFALRGVTPDDKLVARNAAYAGALVAGGLVIWMLGLYNA